VNTTKLSTHRRIVEISELNMAAWPTPGFYAP